MHEIKYDGYHMHARIDGRDIKLLTRTGLDWSHRYRRTIEALANSEISLYRRRAQRTQYPTDEALLLREPLVQPRHAFLDVDHNLDGGR